MLERLSAHDEATLFELCVELAARGVEVHRATVGRFLNRLGLSNKKKPEGKRAVQTGNRQSA